MGSSLSFVRRRARVDRQRTKRGPRMTRTLTLGSREAMTRFRWHHLQELQKTKSEVMFAAANRNANDAGKLLAPVLRLIGQSRRFDIEAKCLNGQSKMPQVC